MTDYTVLNELKELRERIERLERIVEQLDVDAAEKRIEESLRLAYEKGLEGAP